MQDGKTEAPRAAEAGTAGILIVDDNVDAAQTLGDLLDVMGWQARTAHDAVQAMKVLVEFSPKVALLDIGLPDVDGYQLARMIRSHPQGQRMKLVALTGYGRDNDRERSHQVGFDEHLVKPVDIDRLLQVLQGLVG